MGKRIVTTKTSVSQKNGTGVFVLIPSNGGRTYPLVHGNGHCDWVQADGTAHEPPHARRTIPATVARMHRLIVENRKGFHTKSICLFLFPIEQKSVVVGFVTIDGILG